MTRSNGVQVQTTEGVIYQGKLLSISSKDGLNVVLQDAFLVEEKGTDCIFS